MDGFRTGGCVTVRARESVVLDCSASGDFAADQTCKQVRVTHCPHYPRPPYTFTHTHTHTRARARAHTHMRDPRTPPARYLEAARSSPVANVCVALPNHAL